jgi:HEAT repeat protein
LRQGLHGDYGLAPPQLAAAVEQKRRRETSAVEHVRATLHQGVRNFTVSEALLSPQGFKRIHALRSAIKVSDEEATLMLRCALAYEDGQLPGAIDYWLQRIAGGPARVEVLFDALFGADAGIRHRAVQRLAGVNEPEIRNQLYLLALRDPSPAVRADAVKALEAAKDDDLRRSLLQEINEPNSPYRLQAIEALRVFTDPGATAALVHIVHRNAPGQDAEARLKAIEVLGTQNTAPAADALLDIALEDPDADDRAGAAGALASIADERLLARILEKVRRLRGRAARWRPSLSARGMALTLVFAIAAALAVIVSLVVHGLLLASIRRWRLAAAVLACEAAGLALLGLAVVPGLALVLTSWVLGTLVPLRILLHERLDFAPQSPFVRSLSAVLFAFCSATFFLYLHGLASMLARRGRRGLVLFGFEVLGALFVMSALYFEDEFAGIVFGASSLLFGSLGVIGPLVLAATYLTGVGAVLLEAFVLRDRRAALGRIDDICARLLQSAAVSSLVFRGLTAESRDDARWGRELVNRFGEWMQEPLRRQWRGADRATQRRIFGVLAGRRDAGTVQFLRAVAPSVGWGARLRAFWAGLAFRLSVWPRPLLIGIALVLYAQAAISSGLFAMFLSRPDRLLAVVQDQSESVERRQDAVSRLRLIAQQSRNRDLANTAADGLVGALSAGSLSDPVTTDVLQAIVEVAPASENQRDLVDSVVRLLGDRGVQTEAIDALGRIGSPYAALKLAEFARDRIEFVLGATAAGAPGEEAMAAARRALEILKGIPECGEETVRLLTALGARRPATPSGPEDPVASAILSEVRDVTGQLDPLSRAEYFLIEQNYTAAIAAGNRVLAQVPINGGRRERARTIVGRAYASRGALAVASDDETAMLDLFAALDAGLGYTAPGEILGLGLQVAYQYHEFVAPGDPQAYTIVHDVLSRIEPLAQEQALRESVLANLAESSLTVGRYDDAIAIAGELAAQPSAGPSTVLNMKYMLFAALTLKGDRARAAQALADLNSYLGTLPEDFSNNWSYMGTARYIERVAPEPEKQVLLQTIARIAPGG